MAEDRAATEAARKKAEEAGVDVASVEGSGAGGKVTAADVEKATEGFVAIANPAKGDYSVTAYGEDGAARTFYRDPAANPAGPNAQRVTEAEFAALNFETGGVAALARMGG